MTLRLASCRFSFLACSVNSPQARFFVRNPALGMPFLDSLISFISQTLNLLSKRQLRVFKDTKIMLSSLAISRTNNFPCFLVDHYLGLESMFFLFSAVKLFLFFLGRSIGLSVTSITMISIWASGSKSFFFPGKLKFPDFLRAILDFPNNSANCWFVNSPGLTKMKIGSIFSPILQTHQELVFHRKFTRSAWRLLGFSLL